MDYRGAFDKHSPNPSSRRYNCYCCFLVLLVIVTTTVVPDTVIDTVAAALAPAPAAYHVTALAMTMHPGLIVATEVGAASVDPQSVGQIRLWFDSHLPRYSEFLADSRSDTNEVAGEDK